MTYFILYNNSLSNSKPYKSLIFILYFLAIGFWIKAQNIEFQEINLPDEIKSVNFLHSNTNGLWIGSGQGLFVYKNGTFKKYFTEQEKEAWRVNTISTDFSGNFWLGSYNGILTKFKGTEQIEKIDIKSHCKIDNPLITSISVNSNPSANDFKVLISTSGGELFSYDTINKTVEAIENPGTGTIYSIRYGYHPLVWLCTSDGFYTTENFKKWKKKSGFFTVYHITENNGKFWGIGRDNNKKALIMLYYSENENPDRYSWKEFDLQQLIDKYTKFNEMAFSENEIAWIASDKGLIRYNPTNASLILYEKMNDVKLNSLSHIAISGNTIWVSTSGRKLYEIRIEE